MDSSGFPISSEAGIGKLTILVFGLIVAVVVYCGFRIIPIFYSFYELQNHMDQMVRIASTLTDEEVRRRLLYQIHHLDIPVKDEDLKVFREDGRIHVSLTYDEVFYATWQGKDYDLYTFHFAPRAAARVEDLKSPWRTGSLAPQ